MLGNGNDWIRIKRDCKVLTRDWQELTEIENYWNRIKKDYKGLQNLPRRFIRNLLFPIKLKIGTELHEWLGGGGVGGFMRLGEGEEP